MAEVTDRGGYISGPDPADRDIAGAQEAPDMRDLAYAGYRGGNDPNRSVQANYDDDEGDGNTEDLADA